MRRSTVTNCTRVQIARMHSRLPLCGHSTRIAIGVSGVGVVLMLAAMAIYLMSYDLAACGLASNRNHRFPGTVAK